MDHLVEAGNLVEAHQEIGLKMTYSRPIGCEKKETRLREELLDFGFTSMMEETTWRVMARDPRESPL